MSNFWKDFSFPSPIDDLLANPDCTLETLLDDDEVIRDARSNKQVLVSLYVNFYLQYISHLYLYEWLRIFSILNLVCTLLY